MKQNLNISLKNRTFARLGVCRINFQSLVQNRMSKNSLESVRYGILKITCNGLESVLSQSSLYNATKIYSAVEDVLTLTYLNNKHFHMQVCWPILTQHGNTQSKKDTAT